MTSDDIKDTYRTINEPSEGIYKEKGSKFLAFLYPISEVEQVRGIVEELKKRFYDARHHCWAYRLGRDGEVFRTVDDGEPSGTAGRPILGAMMSQDVTNVLCVVVRYFGGVKLGTSGLIVAYRDATLDAIGSAEVVERTVNRVIELGFGYMQVNEVMKLIKNSNPTVLEQVMDNSCRFVVEIRECEAERFIGMAEKIDGVYVEVRS